MSLLIIEPDADEDNYELDFWFLNRTHLKYSPWSLLVKAQQHNPFGSKLIVGWWWPQASIFKIAIDSKHSSKKIEKLTR